MNNAGLSEISCFPFSKTIEDDFALVESLFPREAIALYLPFFEAYPSSVTSFYGYEIPLGRDDIMPDLLLCIHRPEQLMHWLSKHEAWISVTNDFIKRLKTFAGQWQGEKQSQICNVWLEYDVEEVASKNYVPNFFIGPSRNLHPFEAVLMVNELFHTSSIEKETYATLLRCFRKLPRSAWVSQIGRMVAREESNLRLFIQDLPLGSIPEFLRKMCYPGRLDTTLLNWLQLANSVGSKVDLDVDISAGLSSKLGVEIYCKNLQGAYKLLEEFYNLGYCTAIKYEKLKSHFSTLSNIKQHGRYHFLSHFKMVYDGNSAFAAKVYIGFVEEEQIKSVAGTKP